MGVFSWEHKYLDENLDQIKLQIQTLEGPIVFDLAVQKLSLNPAIDIATLEQSGLAWAKAEGLCSGEKSKELESGFIAGLVATCYPAMSQSDAVLWDKWLRVLFAANDHVDAGEDTRIQLFRSDCHKKMHILQRLHAGETLASVVSGEVDPIENALGAVFLDIKSTMVSRGFRHLVSEFIASTNRCFLAVVREREMETNSCELTDDFVSHLRAESSGAMHAIAGAAFLLGISTDWLVKRDVSVDYLFRSAALCFDLSNNLLSHTKDVLDFLNIKTQFPLADDLNAAKCVKLVNVVHVFWSEGLDLPAAYAKTVKAYHTSFNGYQDGKQDLLASLGAEKKYWVNTVKGDASAIPDFESFLMKEQQTKAYLQILDGWMGHVWCALVTPRYNLGYSGDSASALYEMNR